MRPRKDESGWFDYACHLPRCVVVLDDLWTGGWRDVPRDLREWVDPLTRTAQLPAHDLDHDVEKVRFPTGVDPHGRGGRLRGVGGLRVDGVSRRGRAFRLDAALDRVTVFHRALYVSDARLRDMAESDRVVDALAQKTAGVLYLKASAWMGTGGVKLVDPSLHRARDDLKRVPAGEPGAPDLTEF